MKKIVAPFIAWIFAVVLSSCSVVPEEDVPYKDTPQGDPPVVGFFQLPGTTLSGTAAITVSVYDDNTVTNVAFFIGAVPVGTDTAAPFTLDLDTTAFTGGFYTLKVVAWDDAGQTNRGSTNFIINNSTDSRPSIDSVTLPPDPWTGTVTISATASDDSAVTNVYFYLGTNIIGQDATAPYSVDINSRLIADGSYSLHVVAIDDSGQSGGYTAGINIDNVVQLYSSTVYSSYPGTSYYMTNTIDGSLSTHWISSTLSLSDEHWMAYQFSAAVVLDHISLFNDYSQTYAIGDLEILSSTNSTDGTDGTWQSITTVDADANGFVSGDGDVNLGTGALTWIKLIMTFNGSGAYGGPPSFVLSETEFWGWLD